MIIEFSPEDHGSEESERFYFDCYSCGASQYFDYEFLRERVAEYDAARHITTMYERWRSKNPIKEEDVDSIISFGKTYLYTLRKLRENKPLKN